ncbi:MAG: 50S ribosomal protein L6 [Candidatus Paceibacterota bacterium]
MSRVGKQPITLPANTTVTLEGEQYVVNGPKGTLIVPSFEGVTVNQEESTLQLACEAESARPHYGLLRALLSNAVTGVSAGWTRNLELHGVGMRASLAGSSLNLSLGFSHPVVVEAPEGVNFLVTKNVITVSGIDKQLVGETAARIRRFRKPEPYKGKGIRFSDEHVRRKAGKTGKAAK